MRSVQRRTLFGTTAAALLATAAPLRSQSWPARPVHWIVPRAAGGAIDAAGRVVADAVSADLGQPVVIEARPGADGMIGAGSVARAAPDGYSWLLATLNHLVAPLLQPASYHPVKDFSVAARIGGFTSLAVVPPGLPVGSMAELIEYARQRRGMLNYLNSGNGSSMHLATELMKLRYAIDIVAINYKGMQPAIVDLLGGRIDFGFVPTTLVLHHVRAGRLKALAVAGSRRLDDLPSIPTLAEAGLAEIQIDSWMMILAPAGTPGGIIDRMHDITVAALVRPTTQARLAAASLDVIADQSPAELQRYLATEHERFARLIEDAGIVADR